MASLNFKGKSAVWNHHLSVPYHTLEKDPQKSLKGKDDAENLIIQGDNLLALKALLPQYQGKVKCIYIDPPYNTGNEGWVYSDSVSSPTMKEWVGKTVGKEGEDLTRHDKWLCMMTPRLKLLRELLADDGAIFVSIDDNEAAHLKMLMDEIFGEKNFIVQIVWENREGGGGSDSKNFKVKHEYILGYAGDAESFKVLGEEVSNDDDYTNQDEYVTERGKFKLIKLNSFSIQYSASLDYPIKSPEGTDIYPSEDGKRGCWRWSQKKFEWGINNGFIEFKKNGKWIVYTKQYYKVDNENEPTIRCLPPLAVIQEYSSTMATKQMEYIFEKKKVFDYSKPYPLIKKLIGFISKNNSDDIILDSFAGSGTTAHAVLDLNKEDGGHRKFILVEMEEYADKITAERVRRAVKKEGYDAGFTYYTLGASIDAENLLTGNLPTYKEFAKYVFYLATGKNHPDDTRIREKDWFAGKGEHESIYLIYKSDTEALKSLAVTLDWAQATHEKDQGRKIVYAPACYLDDEMLDQYNIKFVSIPYNLFERTA